ncbi:MIP18 family protein [Daphnia magna]|uniref:MIP18 family protein n=1 Tax=Daphnia magna TaxID=35525 RepID=A0A164M2I7_9CRUS|nr:MIP18 family protein [Daphnia magna]
MTSKGIENVNPQRFVKQTKREVTIEEKDESVKDPIDEREIFDLLRDISDPEHPMSLEELNVVQITNIEVDDHENSVKVFYTPTIPHCSMATLIGLSIKEAVNKQLADKERVSAALENSNLLEVVNQCIVKSLE